MAKVLHTCSGCVPIDVSIIDTYVALLKMVDAGRGPAGESAYQVAVDNGFVGTEEEWLASLVGPQGPQGNQGVQGETGPQGPIGPQGIQGNTGSSVAYPYELVNNCTTDDATKGLSAAQGVALAGEISQLNQEVNSLFDSNADNADLLISDENTYVLAEFSHGHFRTKEFDSSKVPTTSDDGSADGDLLISDENDNIVAAFFEGAIITKNFDSRSFTGNYTNPYEGQRISLKQNAYDIKRETLPTSHGALAKEGFDICDGKIFRCCDTGVCEVLDLKTKELLASFELASHDSDNHANVACFGDTIPAGAGFPVLYVSIGKVGAANAMQCSVEKISENGGVYSAEQLQVITLDTSGYAQEGLTPPWSVPAFLIDKERGFLWTFSAKIRTTPAVTGDFRNNTFVAHRFNIPDLSLPTVTLTADDVLQECLFRFDAYATQGGTMMDGKIYFCFGLGNSSAPPKIRVYDTDTSSIYARIDLNTQLEIEDISIYEGGMFVNTSTNTMFQLTF